MMIFPGRMNKITSHQLHEIFSDLKLVRRELPIVQNWLAVGETQSSCKQKLFKTCQQKQEVYMTYKRLGKTR